MGGRDLPPMPKQQVYPRQGSAQRDSHAMGKSLSNAGLQMMNDNVTPTSVSSKQARVNADQYKENRDTLRREMDDLTQGMN